MFLKTLQVTTRVLKCSGPLMSGARTDSCILRVTSSKGKGFCQGSLTTNCMLCLLHSSTKGMIVE